MLKIKKNITKEELKGMGFSKLAVEFVYSRRGKTLDEIKEEAHAMRNVIPYAVLRNIFFIVECNKNAR